MSAVYIAGPMTGLPEFNYPAFHEAEARLRAAGHAPSNPARIEADNPTPGVAQDWSWYMRRALRLVVDAEGVALLAGWEQSRGAQLEVHVAEALGMRVAPLEAWLSLCSECSESIAVDDLGSGHGMCGSCLHDAVRSGWEPGL